MVTATSPSRPRFRQDLVAESIDEDGQRYVDVMDPDTGNAFRFYEVEYSLACAMDGERDVAGLVSWAQEELGITPTPNELGSVIATLGDLGYLDRAAADLAVSPGVVVPTPPARPPATDVALGHAGAERRPMDRVQQVDDVGLGRAGASAAKSAPIAARPAADLLGPAGARPAMSKTPVGGLDVDLSADLPLAASDVKEAVRASKVMKAELPPDLDAALKSAEASARPAVAKEPPRRAPTPAPVAAKEPARPAKQPTRPPVEARGKPPTMPPMEAPRTSPALIAALVLVALGAGGFLFYKYYWQPRHQSEPTVTAPTRPPIKAGSGSAAIKPPTPPPPVEAALAMSTPPPVEIQSPSAGGFASVAADGAVVAKGDEIARFTGADRLQSDLKSANREVARVQNQLDKLVPQRDGVTGAAAARLDAQIKDRMASLAKKQEDKAAIEAEIEKLVVRAPVAGTIKPIAAKGKKVAANAVIASIQPAGVPTATFELRPGHKFAVDEDVTLKVVGADTTLTCKITALEDPAKLVVACPADGAPAEGTKVQLP